MHNEQQKIADRLTRTDPIRWVFAGDSIAQGALHTMGWRDYTELFCERVRWEKLRLRDVVIKTAISGWRVPDLAADLEWTVLQHRPDVLSIALGMNDCAAGKENLPAFTDGLAAIIERSRAAVPGLAVVVHTPQRILPLDPVRCPHLEDYVNAVREVAKRQGAVLVDHYAAWQEAETKGTLAYRLSDAIHPNEIGHRAMAKTLLESLGLWGVDGITAKLMIV